MQPALCYLFFFTKPSKLQLGLVPVILDPGCNIVSVAVQPRNLAPDCVLALRKRLSKHSGVDVLEECVHSIQLLLLRKATDADRDHAAEHGRVAAQSLMDIRPLLRHKLEQSLNTLGVGAESVDREVQVLALDLARQNEVERLLNESGLLGTA
jgi:hypothetical protein